MVLDIANNHLQRLFIQRVDDIERQRNGIDTRKEKVVVINLRGQGVIDNLAEWDLVFSL